MTTSERVAVVVNKAAGLRDQLEELWTAVPIEERKEWGIDWARLAEAVSLNDRCLAKLQAVAKKRSTPT